MALRFAELTGEDLFKFNFKDPKALKQKYDYERDKVGNAGAGRLLPGAGLNHRSPGNSPCDYWSRNDSVNFGLCCVGRTRTVLNQQRLVKTGNDQYTWHVLSRTLEL